MLPESHFFFFTILKIIVKEIPVEKIIEKIVDNPVEKIIYQVFHHKILNCKFPQINRAAAGSREADISGMCSFP